MTLQLNSAKDSRISGVTPKRSIFFDGFAVNNNGEIFIAKYDNMGNLEFVKTYGKLYDSNDRGRSIICDENDYLWSKQIIGQYQLDDKCEILLSPSHGQLAEATLANWILRDQLKVRFQFQLHKYLWGDKPGV